MANEGARADVNLYLNSAGFETVVQAIANITCTDGTEVRFAVPFSGTQEGDTPEKKYRREYSKLLAALKSGGSCEYGEKGWRVLYDGREALIGTEISEVYSAGASEEERLDLEAFTKALEQICSDPERIMVSEHYDREKPGHYQETFR